MAAALIVVAGCGSTSSPQASVPATSPPVAQAAVPDRGATGVTGAKARATHHATGAAAPESAHPTAAKKHPVTKASGTLTPTKTTPIKKPPANPVLAGALPGVLPLARTSVNQVVLLHDLAIGTTHLAGAPPGVGAPQAAQLATALSGEVAQLKVPEGSVQPSGVALLSSTLTGYAGLAKQLAARPATDTAPLSPAFVATLRKLDGRWTAAVVAIGKANHVKLLTGMAPLLIPHTG
jgi:hypothetical protein